MKTPSSNTGKKPGKRTDLATWITRQRPPAIGEAEFAELSAALAPISENYLRKLLRESGVPLAPIVAGVRQATADQLESSLLALSDEYVAGDPARRARVRRLVIAAKDHARWASRKHPEKEEMILWMITWLENPPLFPDWVQLRKARQDLVTPSTRTV